MPGDGGLYGASSAEFKADLKELDGLVERLKALDKVPHLEERKRLRDQIMKEFDEYKKRHEQRDKKNAPPK